VQSRLAGHRKGARLGGTAIGLLMAGLLVWAGGMGSGCFRFQRPGRPPAVFLSQGPISETERYCAWYGDARDGVLYYGLSPFWSAYRAHGADPTADLREAGPQRIGRLDLRRRRLLPPLEVTAPGARSGVWDVLAHPSGRIFYTTFFEAAGWVDPESGEVRRLEAAGQGLNELAPGPGDSILASRYAGPEGGDGSVVVLGPRGEVRAEHVLAPVPGYRVAPKTVAWDPVRREIWVNTDLLPRGGGGAAGGQSATRARAGVQPGGAETGESGALASGGAETGELEAELRPRHDARVLGPEGAERHRWEEPELQFVAFRGDGWGLAAEVDDEGLWLRALGPDDPAGSPRERGERFLADAFFDRESDFAQDIQFADAAAGEGRAVVMRWSGRLHVVDPELPLARTYRLPRRGEGLYYTGVLENDRVCATLCRGAEVVCRGGMGW